MKLLLSLFLCLLAASLTEAGDYKKFNNKIFELGMRGDWAAAEKVAIKAIDWASKQGGTLGKFHEIHFTSHRAQILLKQGKTKNAIKVQEGAQKLLQHLLAKLNMEEKKFVLDHDRVFQDLATMYVNHREFRKGHQLANEWTKILTQAFGAKNPRLSKPLLATGSFYFLEGKHSLAQKSLNEALALAKKGKDKDAIAEITGVINLFMKGRGELNAYEKTLTLSIEQASKKRGKKHPDYFNAKLDLIGFYLETKQYELASKHLLEIQSIRDILGKDNKTHSRFLYSLGALALNMGDPEMASQIYAQCITLRMKLHGNRSQKTMEAMLAGATANLRLKNFKRAKRLLDICMKVQEETYSTDSLQYAECLREDAVIDFMTGNIAAAISKTDEVIQAFEKHRPSGHAQTVSAYADMGVYLSALKDKKQSAQLAKKFLTGRRKQLANFVSEYGSQRGVGYAKDSFPLVLYIAHLCGDTKLFLEAQLSLKGAIVEVETLKNFALRSSTEKEKILAMIAKKRAAYGLFKNEEVSVWDNQLSEKLAQSVKQRMQERLSPPLPQLAKALKNRNAALIESSVVLDPSIKKLLQLANQNETPAKEEVMIFRSSIMLPDGSIHAVLHDYKKLQEAVSTYHKALKDADSEELRKSCREIYNIYLEPLLSVIPQGAKIIFSLDGTLQTVPLDMMLDPTNQPLARTRIVSYTNTGRDLLLTQSKKEGADTALVLGDADFNHHPNKNGNSSEITEHQSKGINGLIYENLEGTKVELGKIHHLLASNGVNVSILSKQNASEQAFRTHADKSKIIHLATHADYKASEQKTEHPYILFSGCNNSSLWHGAKGSNSDGVMYVYDFFEVDLSGVELCVLSACKTAVGTVIEGEGVMSLRRAFKMAGAQNLVTTLWEIPDDTTPILMENFYRVYLQGASCAQALGNAKMITYDKHLNNGSFYEAHYRAGAFIAIE